MNRAMLRLSLACLVMFALLLINVTYVQAFRASSLASGPGNVRSFNQQFQYKRGAIVAGGTAGGTTSGVAAPASAAWSPALASISAIPRGRRGFIREAFS